MTDKKKFVLTAALAVLLSPAIALAQTDPDPGATASTLVDLLMQGQYIPAVGASIMLITLGLRWGLGYFVPWFKSKPGGYVLGFGTAALLYVGAMIKDGSSFSVGLLIAALGAGWMAAGKWESLRDLLTWMRRAPGSGDAGQPPSASGPGRAALGTALALAGVFGCLALGAGLVQACGPAKHAGAVVIDCTKVNANKTAELLDELKPLLAGRPLNWQSIEDKAIEAGEAIGGCVLATIVQEYLGGPSAPTNNDGWSARSTLEHFRANYANGAVFHTARGDL